MFKDLSRDCQILDLKRKKYHKVEKIPKSDQNIVETGNIYNQHRYTRPIGTGTIKGGGVNNMSLYGPKSDVFDLCSQDKEE